MIYERQKLLLAMVATNGGRLGKLDFQKLLFLYTQTCEEVPSYEFVPFKKGCYSFASIADKHASLIRDTWLNVDGKQAPQYNGAYKNRYE